MLSQVAMFHSLLWLSNPRLLCLHTAYSLSIHPSVDTGCFHILGIGNNAPVNIEGYICLFELVFSFSLDKYPKLELLDHMIVLLLIF